MIPKAFSPEEQELFCLLNRLDPTDSWGGMSAYLLKYRDLYLAEAEALCAGFGIPFLELNQAPSFRENRWLFVDRVHLTDDGYELAAEEVRRAFSL